MDSELVKKVKLSTIDLNSMCALLKKEHNPILFTDVFEVFPCLEGWNTDFLIKAAGHKNIKVNTSDTGDFVLNPNTGVHDVKPIDMSVKNYVENMLLEHSRGKIYAQQISLLNTLPEILQELKILEYIPKKELISVNMWFGPGNNTSPMHFDGANNFFIQMLGDKKMWLYSPKYFHELYPYSWTSRACYLSKVNPAAPDFTQYPKFLKTTKTEVTVPRGTILFLPAYWWHQVYSISTSISVNIWWKASLKQKCVPAHLHSSLNNIFNFIRGVKV